METLRALYLRRTIRKFTSKKIPDKTLFRILDAGRQAPIAGNLQTMKYIIILDKELKKKVASAAAKQMWLADAYALVVICSITDKVKRRFGKRGELYAIQNSALTAQNILIAATSYNIGSAIVGAFAEKTMKRHLSIPDEIDPHAIIALGYPQRMPKQPPRTSLGDTTYFGEWDNKTKEEFDPFPLGEKFKRK